MWRWNAVEQPIAARQEAERIAAEKLADSLMPPPEVPRVMKEPTPSQPVPVVVPSDDSVPPEDEDSQRTQVLSQEPTYPDSPRDITAEPIDRTALADNLFASGKFELAMKIYRDLVVVNPKTADDVWHHYQLACCYRHLGSIQEAEKHYRIVAGSKEDEHLAENARWWLDWLQKQTEASQKLNLLRSSLEQLLKEFPDDQPSQ